MRTAPLDGPDICVRNGFSGIRRNVDGGYTVASPQGLADVTPEMFARLWQFLPALKARWSTTRLRIGPAFVDNWKMPRHWSLDAPSPFERDRVHDIGPAPWNPQVWSDARALYPFLARSAIAETWGGALDVTPDVLPVISPIERLPGLVVASGFSGAGFGAGPAAGKLAADLVTGARPGVDPSPYRHGRFFDGTRLVLAE
jgi:glycine/D-amino acid oxidase-like deaminating enzyme